MKTTEEWFNELKEDYRDKALKNMKSPKTEHYSLAGAVSNGFAWQETPEGKDYWNGVFREIMYGEKFLPNLPTKKVEPKVEKKVVEPKIEQAKVDVQKIEPTVTLELEEKGGNIPDLLNQYKAQQDNTK
jgi:hypothetical protein